jgi:DNA-binding transcriptional regulator YhcF (GntR family)
MPSIEEIRRQFGLDPALEKEASDDSLQKEAHNSVSREINEYLNSQTLSVFVEQLEKEAGATIDPSLKAFIVSAEAQGMSEEQIINFIQEKANAQ